VSLVAWKRSAEMDMDTALEPELYSITVLSAGHMHSDG
jgi:hypothetical protein